MKKLLLVLLIASFSNLAICQSIGIGTTSPNSSAILDLQSNAKGFLLPRMTKTERNAISNPATGLLLYQNTDTSGFFSNTGTPALPVWKKLDGTSAGVPTGTIIISDKFPDTSLTNAGFAIIRAIFLDSSAQYGPYGNWTNMDTTNCQYFNLDGSAPQMVTGGGYIYTYGGNSTTGSIIARYNISTNTWEKLTNLPAGLQAIRTNPTILWANNELLIWGGDGVNTGYRYLPYFNSWITMATGNGPSARNNYLSCYTGTDLIIWGGTDAGTGTALTTGSRYNLSSNIYDNWTPMTNTNAPAFQSGATAVKDGSAMYVYGGSNASASKVNKYDAATNTWVQNTPGGASVPVRRNAKLMSYNGFLYMYGGSITSAVPPYTTTTYYDGYVYNTATNSWSTNVGIGASAGLQGIAIFQKGSKVYSFGGANIVGAVTNELGVKDIAAANPAYTQLSNAPVSPRLLSYVDTLPGNRLIFWGGSEIAGGSTIPVGEGFIYNIGNNTYEEIASEGSLPPSSTANTKTVSGKFVIWNLKNGSSPIGKGFIYTPDVNGFGKPQAVKLYLYQKN